MCGIAGYFVGGTEEVCSTMLLRMANAITHRGPNDEGVWIDRSTGVGLAHRRLSIIDLSPAGHQPMESASGRYMIVFNGEVYNHASLRTKLEKQGVAPVWRGHSDTETLLAAIESWGVEKTLLYTVGMFAIALWDRVTCTLTLCRDRFGEKPLYYGWQGKGHQAVFLFGSELSALRQHSAFNAEVDRNALALYMRHNCIGGEYTIYTGIRKLKPGHLLTVSRGSREPKVHCWWSSASVAGQGVINAFKGSPDDAVDVLEGLLLDSISQQMVTDVPLGAFLSGGIDSSTVVALMQAQSNRPVRTFSIGFHESDYNEADHAKLVARHLGTEHTELYVSADQAMAVIPRLPALYSEPFADSSQIPTFLVSQLAQQHVTVSLSGDAGDELFCGYNRYQMTAGLWGKIAHVPRPLRQLWAATITAVSPSVWDKLSGVLPMANVGDKLHKGASLLGSRTMAELYDGMVTHWLEPSAVVLGADEFTLPLVKASNEVSELGDVERMMLIDLLTYLPDDILVKVDRAAMGVGLETRVPFLDHRIVEFAWTLPLAYKLRNGVTKWPLRQVLYRHVPRELIERPKMGFGVPIGQWLRGPLRDWAESLLSEPRLKSEGFLNPLPIRQKWAEHLSGRRNWQYLLWDVLMFQAWLEAQ